VSRILVVEDDQRAAGPDLVILDRMLPLLDGIATVFNAGYKWIGVPS
jgi:DNA-binding response OmpR family regulator